MKTPLVSIVIATKNEESNLPRLLLSLKKQEYSPIEIIVVDNFSTDKTLEIAQLHGCKTIQFGNERSAQRNKGTRMAKGSYLLFLDADMELPLTVVKEAVSTIHRSNAVALIIPEDIPVTSFFTRIKQLEKRMYWNRSAIEAPRFFERHSFQKIQGYDESLIAGEDWDIGQRAKTFGTISRTRIPLFHHENSFMRELQHKWYYAKHIERYQKSNSSQVSLQTGIPRFMLFWKNRSLMKKDPAAYTGLIILKGIEYLIYLSAKLSV